MPSLSTSTVAAVVVVIPQLRDHGQATLDSLPKRP